MRNVHVHFHDAPEPKRDEGGRFAAGGPSGARAGSKQYIQHHNAGAAYHKGQAQQGGPKQAAHNKAAVAHQRAAASHEHLAEPHFRIGERGQERHDDRVSQALYHSSMARRASQEAR